ncbi:MAG: S24 family peptidase [Ignavibacteriales bacterium]|nr:S24 family peptidase [Ignavibacteriales bacterium]
MFKSFFVDFDMNWQQFIIKLLDQDLRLSSLEVEKLTSIRQQIVDRWKRGGIDKPHRNTIRRLEQGLHIRIDDADPENIMYSLSGDTDAVAVAGKKQGIVEQFNSGEYIFEANLPIEAQVPAGLGAGKSFEGDTLLQFDSRNQFALMIDTNNGESLQPFLHPGDIIICDTRAQVCTGDMVAARWDTTNAAVKILGDSSKVPDSYLLYSYNPIVKPIIVKKENARLYKVVFIKKQS